MQHLFLDCSHGMSGDMTLASLAHLGVDLSPLPGLLAQAGVACRLEVWQEERGGGPGCRVEVSWEAEGQPLRHPADIAAIFAAVPVADRVRHKALAVLEALTLAEAEAHGIAPEEVHFHEVGAVDTLVDILGACWALDQLGVERVTACALPWFGGSITCAHGEIPLPAPATANLMRGLPVYPTDAKTELVTPTGAALARVLVDEFVGGPEGRLLAMGTGKKNRPAGLLRVLCRPADTENVARAVLRHTHTLGLRRQLLQRLVLPRRATTCACGGASLPAFSMVPPST